MWEDIGGIAIGIVIIIIGVMNMRGNISTLHHYHRKRVSEENRLPFGRLVGLGTIIVGLALVVFGAFSLITYFSGIQIFRIVGAILVGVGLIVGIVISFYAMKKYNGGIM